MSETQVRRSTQYLSTVLRSYTDTFAFVVPDHIGGHIRSSIWVPSAELDVKTPELVRTLHDKDKVVFHCALSQQRGPSAALRYARERQRLLSTGKAEGEGQQQQVYVLEGGFTMWQAKYGEDEKLTEGYVRDIWMDY
jgi:rhodanese-related sulfurtransferase